MASAVIVSPQHGAQVSSPHWFEMSYSALTVVKLKAILKYLGQESGKELKHALYTRLQALTDLDTGEINKIRNYVSGRSEDIQSAPNTLPDQLAVVHERGPGNSERLEDEVDDGPAAPTDAKLVEGDRYNLMDLDNVDSDDVGSEEMHHHHSGLDESTQRLRSPESQDPIRKRQNKGVAGPASKRPTVQSKPERAPYTLRNRTKECIVCMDHLTPDEFPEMPLTNGCNHSSHICLSCITMHLDTQIAEKAWDQISCPGCNEKVIFAAIKTYASVQSFERYHRNSVISSTKDMPNFTMCLGPNCDSGQIHGGGNEQPMMTCTTCGFKTCFTHQLPWHMGLTCEDFDTGHQDLVEQEAASQSFLARETKICPNKKCGVHVMKIDGCDHMTCHRCSFQFCWLCEEERYADDSHAPDCKYHFRNQLAAAAARQPMAGEDVGPRRRTEIRADPSARIQLRLAGSGNGNQQVRAQGPVPGVPFPRQLE